MKTIDCRNGVAKERPPRPDALAWLTIDLNAVIANWQDLRNRLRSKQCAAVVKADAYGLGLEKVGPALYAGGCRLFFVAQLQEALALRRLLPRAEIAVLNGVGPHEAPEFAAGQILPVLNDRGQLRAWDSYCAGAGKFPAILHIDTGMNRLGLLPKEALALQEEPLKNTTLRALISHLACADEPFHPLNLEQLKIFSEIRPLFPAIPASLAASSGLFLDEKYQFDFGRPGAAIYGLNPTPGKANPQRPTLRLEARILQVRRVDRPMTVGYGAAYSVRGPTSVATIGVGYADGYLRSLNNRGRVTISGITVPIIGRVSMDLITLDVTELPEHLAQPGQVVCLIGDQLTPDGVAQAAETIGYEILTSLGHRYTRRYLEPTIG